MTINFITFGGGTTNYLEAGIRVCEQATKINLFDKITLFTGETLEKDEYFWNKHCNFIMNNISKGYGYWLWKPYIIKKTLDSLNDGDILLYLDCGCEISNNKKNEMVNYINNIIKNEYIITSFTFTEKNWNKMDLILYLNANSSEILETPQRQAGAILLYVCDKTRKLVNEWYNTSCNYNLIDDSSSISKNYNGFREHRHDQAIFSLLTKKYNIKNTYNIESIIEYIRNRTGKSRFN
jgi:hypothetical protein